MEIDREEYMVEKYGECVKQTVAAKILGITAGTVRNMLDDGRLEWTCAGTMVCVHSIARYMEQPKQENFKARQRRAGRKWAVV